MNMITTSRFQVSSALIGAACTASAQSPFLRTWVNITAATFLAANGPAVGNDHSNSRPKQNGG
jgi:hypothetical protein